MAKEVLAFLDDLEEALTDTDVARTFEDPELLGTYVARCAGVNGEAERVLVRVARHVCNGARSVTGAAELDGVGRSMFRKRVVGAGLPTPRKVVNLYLCLLVWRGMALDRLTLGEVAGQLRLDQFVLSHKMLRCVGYRPGSARALPASALVRRWAEKAGVL